MNTWAKAKYYRALKQIAWVFGIPVKARKGIRYDGQTIQMGIGLAHEIGHWVAATSTERNLVDWGLELMDTTTNLAREEVADDVGGKLWLVINDAIDNYPHLTVFDEPTFSRLRGLLCAS